MVNINNNELVFKTYPEMNMKTKGKWIDGRKIQVEYVNAKGKQRTVLRQVYFRTNDLYITIQGKRYYYSEFE